MTNIEKEIIGSVEGFAKNTAGIIGSFAGTVELIRRRMEGLTDHDRTVLSDGVQMLLENEKQIVGVAKTLRNILEDHQ